MAPRQPLPRSESIHAELLDTIMAYPPAETVSEDMFFDVVEAAEATLAIGADGILDAARELDAQNHPALADVEVYQGMGTGKLMDLYERALQTPLDLFADNPDGQEEWARLVVMQQYVSRKFMILCDANQCESLLEFEALRRTDQFTEAMAIAGSLVSMCRPDTVHFKDIFRGAL